jgi:hypothetical protein
LSPCKMSMGNDSLRLPLDIAWSARRKKSRNILPVLSLMFLQSEPTIRHTRRELDVTRQTRDVQIEKRKLSVRIGETAPVERSVGIIRKKAGGISASRLRV